MPYNPHQHHRRSIRLPGYDYTAAGAYFVTIVTFERACLFGEVLAGKVQLSPSGEAAAEVWQRLPRTFPLVLDVWLVMPNHIHGIIFINPAVDNGMQANGYEGNLPAGSSTPRGAASGSLGAVVGNFKSVSARKINRLRATPGSPVWQRNYYERILRNETELAHIRRYISSNPLRWETDEDYIFP